MEKTSLRVQEKYEILEGTYSFTETELRVILLTLGKVYQGKSVRSDILYKTNIKDYGEMFNLS